MLFMSHYHLYRSRDGESGKQRRCMSGGVGVGKKQGGRKKKTSDAWVMEIGGHEMDRRRRKMGWRKVCVYVCVHLRLWMEKLGGNFLWGLCRDYGEAMWRGGGSTIKRGGGTLTLKRIVLFVCVIWHLAQDAQSCISSIMYGDEDVKVVCVFKHFVLVFW